MRLRELIQKDAKDREAIIDIRPITISPGEGSKSEPDSNGLITW